MLRTPPTDARVVEMDGDGWRVKKHTEPAGLPASPLFTVKGLEVTEGVEFTRSGGEVTWAVPISVHAFVEVYDGETLVWKWSVAEGDLVTPE